VESLPKSHGQKPVTDNIRMTPQRKKAMEQLLTSETEYCYALMNVHNYYLRPMKNAVLQHKIPITESDISTIFGCFENICQLHLNVLKTLEINFRKDFTPGEVFVKIAPMMKIYITYAMGAEKRRDLLKKLRRITKIEYFLAECKRESKSEFDLEHFLELPMNRLYVYENIFQAIIDHTPESSSDKERMISVVKTIKSIYEQVEKKYRGSDEVGKVLEISNRISGLPDGLDLVAPYRVFVKEGPLDMTQSDWKKTKPQSYFVFLFNDLLVVAKKPSKFTSGSRRYICELVLKLHECHIDRTRDGRAAFVLFMPKNGVFYSFYCSDQTMKESWSSAIQKTCDNIKNTRQQRLLSNPTSDESPTMKLKVNLVCGRNLLPTLHDVADIFCLFRLSSQSQASAVSGGDKGFRSHPLWEQEFFFDVYDPSVEFLEVSVRDKKQNRLLGKTKIDLEELFDYVKVEKWYRLEGNRGELLIGLTIGPTFVSTPSSKARSRTNKVSDTNKQSTNVPQAKVSTSTPSENSNNNNAANANTGVNANTVNIAKTTNTTDNPKPISLHIRNYTNTSNPERPNLWLGSRRADYSSRQPRATDSAVMCNKDTPNSPAK
jgi:hypothetical protein